MGNINISDLRPAGADLFLDSESYLNDLTEGEMLIFGGRNSGNSYQCSENICSYAKTCNGGEMHVLLSKREEAKHVLTVRVAFALAVG